MSQPFVYLICLLILILSLAGCAAPAPGAPVIPDLTATAAAIVIQDALNTPPTKARETSAQAGLTPTLSTHIDVVATAVAATLTAQFTATPSATPLPTATDTPNAVATQTAVATRLNAAVAATLTAQPTPLPTAPPTPDLAATQASKTQALATAVAATLTAVPTLPAVPTLTPVASVYNFTACLEPCAADRSNARRSFPEGVQTIYLQWDYANLPVGARYTRIWTLQGKGEWVRYRCTWPGPTAGEDKVTLSEPDGLHSGVWEVVINVNDVALMREQIVVEGNGDYWFYAGIFDSCYGKLH